MMLIRYIIIHVNRAWLVATCKIIFFQLHMQLALSHPRLLSELYRPVTFSQQLASMTSKLHACLCNQSLLSAKPIVLAIAILSLELEQCCHSWFPITVLMQRLTSVSI